MIPTMFATIWSETVEEFQSRDHFTRVGIAVWLLLPLLLFMGRAPADIGVSLLGIMFLGRSFVHRDWGWLKSSWVRAVLVLWIYMVIRGALSEWPINALEQSLRWIRFPMVAIATTFWLIRSDILLKATLAIVALGVSAMSLTMAVETILVYPSHLLTGPYENVYPRFYLARVGLPVFGILLWYANRHSGPEMWKALIAAGLLYGALFLSGGRSELVLCTLALALHVFVFDRFNIRRLAAGFLVAITVVTTINFAHEGLRDRFFALFSSQNPVTEQGRRNVYMSIWVTGLRMGRDFPVFGVGPGNYEPMSSHERYDVEEDNWVIDDHITRHAHNTYIQMFSENGIVGLALFAIMLFYLWRAIIIGWKKQPGHWRSVIAAGGFIFLSWPLIGNLSFYSQIYGVMSWFMFAIALTAAHLSTHGNKQ